MQVWCGLAGSSEHQTARFTAQNMTVAVPTTYAATVVYSTAVGGEPTCAIVQEAPAKLEPESSGESPNKTRSDSLSFSLLWYLCWL